MKKNTILLILLLTTNRIVFCQYYTKLLSVKTSSNTVTILIGDKSPELLDDDIIENCDSKSLESVLSSQLRIVLPVQYGISPFISANSVDTGKSISIKNADLLENNFLLKIKNVLDNVKIINENDRNFLIINLNKFSFNYSLNKLYLNKTYQLVLQFKNSIEAERFAMNFNRDSNNNLVWDNLASVSSTLNNKNLWINYNALYWKIGVNSDGIYRITYDQLAKSGAVLSGITPKQFQLFCKGQEQQIFVSGSEDNTFDPIDYIEFIGEANVNNDYRKTSKHGESYKEYYNRYTDTTVYWLTLNNTIGKRTVNNPVNIVSSDTVDYYNQISRYENNSWFDFSMEDQPKRESPFWYENKTWVEAQLAVGTRNTSLSLTDIYPNKKAYLFAKLQDYASNVIQNAHLVALGINQDKVIRDSTYINKYQQAVLKDSINSNLLINGTNTLKVYSYKTTASLNACATDWYEIEYPRFIKPMKDTLVMKFPFILDHKGNILIISGVTKQNYIVWKKDSNYSRHYVQNTGASFNIVDSLSSNSKVFLFAENKVKTPFIYSYKRFENLQSPSNKADYLIITHNKFLKKAGEYAQFIEQQYSVKVKVVDVHEIYNEFSYGIFNPEAIREFLIYSYKNWQKPSIKYVLLAGGATYDYFGNKNKFQGAPLVKNYVPSFGASVSDTWFVAWDTTGFYAPNVSIGRIPVTSEEEFDLYLQKHKNYVKNSFSPWNKRYMFFSGGTGDDQNQIATLREVNNYVINNYVVKPPVGGNYSHFYKTINPNTNFGPVSNVAFREAIDSGAVFISYLGHSGTQTWDNSITDPSQLNNTIGRSSMITDFGCSTAKFAEPDVVSFSQLFVTDKKGSAIAYIGNSSLGYTSTSYLFPKLFYNRIFSDSMISVGDAHRLAKNDLLTNYGTGSVNQLFALCNTLIGDPIIKLAIPQKPNLYINTTQIKTEQELITDSNDSAYVKISYNNFGSVKSDSTVVRIVLFSQQKELFSKSFKRAIPNYQAELRVAIPTKGFLGLNKLRVILDPDNPINELNENDNSAEIDLNIVTQSIKLIEQLSVHKQVKNPLAILNPVSKPLSDIVVFQISDNKDFTTAKNYVLKLDTLQSSLNLENIVEGKRYWIKTFPENDPSSATSISAMIGKNSKEVFSDSISYLNSKFENVQLQKEGISLRKKKVNLNVLSAGFNDGNTALIQFDGTNLIPENTLRGHHIVLFDEKSLDFVKYLRMDLLGGGTATQDYIKFLDTVSTRYLIAFAVSDEGKVTSTELISKLKAFGSNYVDKFGFRGSWAMLGRKGGIIKESYSLQYKGRVNIDSSLTKVEKSGAITTDKIGPSNKWIEISIADSTAGESKTMYDIIGTSAEGDITDTLSLNRNGNKLDLSKIDSKKYSYLAIRSLLFSDGNLNQPVIKNISVGFRKPPELAINYQVVSISKDSLDQGEKTSLNFSVYNVGESTASNFKVRVDLVKKDNSKEKLFEQLVDSIQTEKKKDFNLNYTTDKLTGSNQFQITIDPDNTITELYKDNNFYSVPFYVKPNNKPASIKLTIDGNDILNGDFISSKPNFKIELNDESLIPIADTSKVLLYLNNKRIYFANNSGIMAYNYSSSNPKMVVNYTPTLSDGNYTLKVVGKNATDQIIDSTGIVRKFTVKNELQLLNAYNYPNPFKDDTYFTFKLTQLPDELKIIIYTIAGRRIKEIKLNSSELRFDFNRIQWDGRDEDGDLAANGVYLYKIISMKGREKTELTQKLSILR